MIPQPPRCGQKETRSVTVTEIPSPFLLTPQSFVIHLHLEYLSTAKDGAWALWHQTSWELCYQIACEFPNILGPFDSIGLVFSLPSQSPSLPQSTLLFPPALRCLLQSNSQHAVQLGLRCVNTVSTLWQYSRVGKFCFL